MTDANTRYWAEWVSAETPNEFGGFDPDGVEYSRVRCATLAEAQRTAIVRGKAANVTDWTRVTEEQFRDDLGIPRRSDAAWDTTCLWYGDWEGNWTEDRS